MEFEFVELLLPISIGFALAVFSGLIAWGLTLVIRLIKNIMLKGV